MSEIASDWVRFQSAPPIATMRSQGLSRSLLFTQVICLIVILASFHCLHVCRRERRLERMSRICSLKSLRETCILRPIAAWYEPRPSVLLHRGPHQAKSFAHQLPSCQFLRFAFDTNRDTFTYSKESLR